MQAIGRLTEAAAEQLGLTTDVLVSPGESSSDQACHVDHYDMYDPLWSHLAYAR